MARQRNPGTLNRPLPVGHARAFCGACHRAALRAGALARFRDRASCVQPSENAACFASSRGGGRPAIDSSPCGGETSLVMVCSGSMKVTAHPSRREWAQRGCAPRRREQEATAAVRCRQVNAQFWRIALLVTNPVTRVKRFRPTAFSTDSVYNLANGVTMVVAATKSETATTDASAFAILREVVKYVTPASPINF